MPFVIATAEVTNDGDEFTSAIHIHQHEILVDEPLDKGGEDMGPAPGDYLCASLASCKAITLRMYAARKKWNVEQIKVKVDLVKDKELPDGVNTFLCELSFIGDLNEEQIKRLEVIANACHIQKLLSKPSNVVTLVKV